MKTDIHRREQGLSLIELVIVMAIVGIVGSLAMSFYTDYSSTAKTAKTISDLRTMSFAISGYYRSHHHYPPSLAAIGAQLQDQWGRNYIYYDIADGGTQTRKDKNLTPINTDFDLYSMGPDGLTSLPLTAKASKDDIVRANNGNYFGPASEY